ncbi:MAG: haloacid dehalogenase type II [Pseudomonadota bacterium]
MSPIRPKYITFDCYGTLTRFQMDELARKIYGAQMDEPKIRHFLKNFNDFRRDEILGDWKPYSEVLCNAVERTCKKHGIAYRQEDGMAFYHAVPGWGPHPDVPAGLAKVAAKIPLVILSNAMDEQIMSNVDKLDAPFFKVFTAQQANAYKPRLQAFEYMLDSLGCGPEDILHVSSSFRYDLMSAYDLDIKNKVWVDRSHEPANPFYEYVRVDDISGLPAVVGL